MLLRGGGCNSDLLITGVYILFPDMGLVIRHPGAMSQPDASHDLAEYYFNIPKVSAVSIIIVY